MSRRLFCSHLVTDSPCYHHFFFGAIATGSFGKTKILMFYLHCLDLSIFICSITMAAHTQAQSSNVIVYITLTTY